MTIESQMLSIRFQKARKSSRCATAIVNQSASGTRIAMHSSLPWRDPSPPKQRAYVRRASVPLPTLFDSSTPAVPGISASSSLCRGEIPKASTHSQLCRVSILDASISTCCPRDTAMCPSSLIQCSERARQGYTQALSARTSRRTPTAPPAFVGLSVVKKSNHRLRLVAGRSVVYLYDATCLYVVLCRIVAIYIVACQLGLLRLRL